MTIINTTLALRNLMQSTLYLKDDQLKIDAILKYVESMHGDMGVTADDGLKIWYFPKDLRAKISDIFDKVSFLKVALKRRQEIDLEVGSPPNSPLSCPR